jgi:hypothetical protein
MHENLHARFAKLARTKLAIFDVAIHLKTAVFQISRKFQKIINFGQNIHSYEVKIFLLLSMA